MEKKNKDNSDNDLQMDFELEDYDFSSPWQVKSLTRTVEGMELGKIPKFESHKAVQSPSVGKDMIEEATESTKSVPSSLIKEDLKKEVNCSQTHTEKDAALFEKEGSIEKEIKESKGNISKQEKSPKIGGDNLNKKMEDQNENVAHKKDTPPEKNGATNWIIKILLNISVLILAWILYRGFVSHSWKGEL